VACQLKRSSESRKSRRLSSGASAKPSDADVTAFMASLDKVLVDAKTFSEPLRDAFRRHATKVLKRPRELETAAQSDSDNDDDNNDNDPIPPSPLETFLEAMPEIGSVDEVDFNRFRFMSSYLSSAGAERRETILRLVELAVPEHCEPQYKSRVLDLIAWQRRRLASTGPKAADRLDPFATRPGNSDEDEGALEAAYNRLLRAVYGLWRQRAATA
jgi:hypothetical protein